MFLANLVIRPPRREYTDADLPHFHRLPDGSRVIREPLTLANVRGETLHGSFYPAPYAAPGRPAVLMLHGNASSQVEGTAAVPLLCPHGISVLCIDTSGCGRSEGAFITLGLRERADVTAALSYLRSARDIGAIAIWGRSMGAALAVWCAADGMDIQGIIADSPYSSVRGIAEDLVGQHWAMQVIGKAGYWVLDFCVRRWAGFSLREIEIRSVEKAVCPALFVHAAQDSLIAVRQSRGLFARYGGKEKFFVTPDGDHNSNRPRDVTAIEVIFLLQVFGLESDVAVEGGQDFGQEHFGGLSDMLKRWKNT